MKPHKIIGTNDGADLELFKILLKKWPQINPTTDYRAIKDRDYITIPDDLIKTTPRVHTGYDEMKPGLKFKLQRTFASLSGNTKMFNKTMEAKPPEQKLMESRFYFEKFFIQIVPHTYYVRCLYLPSKDILYYHEVR